MRAYLIAAALLATPAHAQRPAISPNLSPEAASKAFEGAVVDACLAAISSGQRLAQTPIARSSLAQTADAETPGRSAPLPATACGRRERPRVWWR